MTGRLSLLGCAVLGHDWHVRILGDGVLYCARCGMKGRKLGAARLTDTREEDA